jgi:hypothetical protein
VNESENPAPEADAADAVDDSATSSTPDDPGTEEAEAPEDASTNVEVNVGESAGASEDKALRGPRGDQ